LTGRTKTYHANMLKKYWGKKHEKMGAMVTEPEKRVKDEINLFTSLQTKTYKDIIINPELTERQNFQDIFRINKCGKTYHHFDY